jgi:hypothetical protein
MLSKVYSAEGQTSSQRNRGSMSDFQKTRLLAGCGRIGVRSERNLGKIRGYILYFQSLGLLTSNVKARF